MKRIPTPMAATAIAALLLLSACGGDDTPTTTTAAAAPATTMATATTEPATTVAAETATTIAATTTEAAAAPTAEEYKAGLAAEVLADSNIPMEAADAACVADNFVDAIGAERLAELGIDPDEPGDFDDFDFTDDEEGTYFDALSGCVDLAAALAAQLPDSTPADAECLGAELDNDEFRALFLDDESVGMPVPVAEAMAGCGVLDRLFVQSMSESGLTVDQAQCIVDSLGEENVITMMTVGPDTINDELIAASAACTA